MTLQLYDDPRVPSPSSMPSSLSASRAARRDNLNTKHARPLLTLLLHTFPLAAGLLVLCSWRHTTLVHRATDILRDDVRGDFHAAARFDLRRSPPPALSDRV